MLELHVFEGKNKVDVLEECLGSLMVTENELYKKETEIEGSLFKSKKYHLEVITKGEIVAYMKEFIHTIATMMKIDIQCEIRESDEIYHILLVSDHNGILIGKDGRTLTSLQLLLRQALQAQTGHHIKVDLDASNYKANKNKNFEYEIRNIAKEVLSTHIPVKLDPMNSFQRRMAHSVVSKYEELVSFSTGEGPERYTTIAYKEDAK